MSLAPGPRRRVFSTDAFGDRQPAVRRFAQPLGDRRGIGVDIEPVDVGARRHHLAGRPVGEADDAGDDRAFAFLEHAGMVRLGDDEVQLLGGDLGRGIAAHPQQPEDQGAGLVEQPDERRGRARDPQHRQRDDGGDRLGRAQRELLGHQLADHQRRISDEDDDEGEAQRAGQLRLDARATRSARPTGPPRLDPE